MQLKLSRMWTIGELLGGGGFGEVYSATGDGQEVAIKFVPKAPGTDRELLFVDLGTARNVVPIIDSGETETHWALVMPKAERSLRDHLKAMGGKLAASEATGVLVDIATTLADLDGHVVHRDLKPENVLLLNDHWCLADFGISRYAEATTSPDTHKYAKTPEYAAPERWRNERATSAADVYALGVIGYELLSGNQPFPGPESEDFRDQHLHVNPIPLKHSSIKLVSLIEECLYKAPGARPSPGNLLDRLQAMSESPASGSMSKLREAHRVAVARMAEEIRQESASQSEREHRTALLEVAKGQWTHISDTLRDAIVEEAPGISLRRDRSEGWTLSLNETELRFPPLVPTAEKPWERWTGPTLEVLAHAFIEIHIPAGPGAYGGRAHSLWFCDAQERGQFGWFETAFAELRWGHRQTNKLPFALAPSEEAGRALSVAAGYIIVVWPFTRIVVGDLNEFVTRWANWFGLAVLGELRRPNQLPERDPQRSWRFP